MISKKQLEQLAGFTVTLVAYSAASFVGMVYFTDWRVVVNYIPYYNMAFKNEKRPDDDK